MSFPTGYTIQDNVGNLTEAYNVVLGGNVTFNGTGNLTWTGIISGGSSCGSNAGGMLIKNGTGTLSLSGANTYSGGTTIVAGTLLTLNTSGSATGSGNVSVGLNGTLAGTGSVSGQVTHEQPPIATPPSLSAASLLNENSAPGAAIRPAWTIRRTARYAIRTAQSR